MTMITYYKDKIYRISSVIWSLTIVTLFFFRREESAIFGARLLDGLLALLILFLICLTAYKFGNLGFILLTWSKWSTSKHPENENKGSGLIPGSGFFFLGLGFSFLSILTFLAGLLKLYYSVTAYAFLALGALLAWKDVGIIWKKIRRFGQESFSQCSISEIVFWSMTFMVLLLGLLAALSPPILGDDMVYHLNIPKEYIKNHGLVEIPHNVYSYFPMGMEMLYVFAMLAKNDILAKLLHYAMGVLVTLAIYCFSQQLGLSRQRSLLAAAIFSTVPTVWMIGAFGAYVDLALAYFVLLMVFSFMNWVRSDQPYWLLICGLTLGFALSIKFTSLYLLPVLFLALALREYLREKLNKPLGRGVSFGHIFLPIIIAIIFSCPWYLRNLYYVGNPFYPFFLNIIPTKSVNWDPERAKIYFMMLGRYGGEVKSVKDYLLLPWNLTLNANLVIPKFYDGIVGPLFLITLPSLVFRRQIPREFKILICFSLLYFVMWMFSSQQVRFLVPVFPLLSILAAFSLSPDKPAHAIGTKITCDRSNVDAGRVPTEGFEERNLRKLLMGLVTVALVGNQVIIGCLFAKHDPVPYFMGLETRQDYLAKNLDYYSLYTYINTKLPEKSRIFLIDTGNFGYYLNRDYFSDSIIENYTLGKIVNESATTEEILKRLKEMHITHLLYYHRSLFDKAYTPFSDEKSTARFYQFLQRYGRMLHADQNFHLWEIRYELARSN